MSLIYIWLAIAIVSFGILAYLIGKGGPYNAEANDAFIVSFFCSFFWPVLVAAAIMFGPFYLLFKLGVKHHERNANKQKMWDTLKK